ncbi:MAG: hypothetical protein JKY09_06730 [Crocinitomicaceae bacterium]|nr:hypothetical protein [Crocinitomicaceae bacterium]
MKKTLLISIISLLSLYSYSQGAQIGQKSEYLLSLVKYRVSSYNSPDSYGRYPSDVMKYDVKYENGRIKDVIIYRYNTLLLPLMKYVDLTTHYEMEDETLSSITVVYSTLSRKEVTTMKEKVSHRLPFTEGEFYLTDDFKGYEVVYMNTANHPCVRYFEDDIFSEEKEQIIEEVKQKVITDRKKKEAELEANKYVNIEELDPSIKDKISLECMEYVERFFNDSHLRNHLRNVYDTLNNIMKSNTGFRIDSSVVKFRVERDDDNYGGPEGTVDVLHGSTIFLRVLTSGASISPVPIANWRKINYVEFDSLEVNTVIGGFKFYVRSTKGERRVYVLNYAPIPNVLSDDFRRDNINGTLVRMTLEEALYQEILNDNTITDKVTYSVKYCSYQIGNWKDFITVIERD